MMKLMGATALALVMGLGVANAQQANSQQGAQAGGKMDCWQQAKDAEGAKQVFSRLDSDKNGRLSQQEYQACATTGQSGSVAFDKLDADSNQSVSSDEFVRVATMQGSGRQQSSNQSSQSAASGAQVTVRQEPAQVQIEKQAPQVTVTQAQPQVTVTQPKPQVTVEQAKPEVTVKTAEPKVTVEKAGDPQVTVKQQQADTTVRTTDRQQSAASGATTRGTETQRSGTPTVVAVQTYWYDPMRVSDLEGKEVRNAAGQEVGDIDEIVLDAQQQPMAVISVGGFLGIGDKDVLVPLDRMRLQGDQVVLMSDRSEDELKQMPEYKRGQYEPLEREQRFSDLRTQPGTAAGSGQRQ